MCLLYCKLLAGHKHNVQKKVTQQVPLDPKNKYTLLTWDKQRKFSYNGTNFFFE